MTFLTQTQTEVLEKIRRELEARDSPPSLRELAGALGYKSDGSLMQLINILRDKGFMEAPGPDKERSHHRSFALTDKGKTFGRKPYENLEDADTLTFPILGQVPAGNPIEAVEARTGVLTISRSFLPPPRPRSDQVFALRAKGQSMIDAAIMDGDTVIVKLQKTAQPRDIVVARFDDGGVTVKRLMKDKHGREYLKPENKDFKPMYGDERPFDLIGKVVAVLRALV